MKKFKAIFYTILVLSLIVLFISCGKKTTEPKETKVATPSFSPEMGTYEGAQYITITCSTQGVTIYYTTDGSTPDAMSPIYNAPIKINSDTIISAQAFKDGWIKSEVAKVSYVINLPTVEMPVFSVEAGTYDSPQSVLISCATEGAEICYTTDGSNPTSSSPIYSEAIKVSETTTIKARAFKTDWTDSDIASATYIISPAEQVATPSFSPPEGSYNQAQSVSISCATIGATIRYTTDGSNPTVSSPIHSGALKVAETTTIIARGFKEDWKDSDLASATYTITPTEQVATPSFSPPEGSYSQAQSVSISCATAGATIRYTTDGSNPTSYSIIYSDEIKIAQTTMIKARAFKAGMTDSEIASANFNYIVLTPVFSPAGGTYNHVQSVSISCATPGATIRYTVNGSNPTSYSTIYSEAINLVQTTTIKARAFKTGWTDSDIASDTYEINLVIPEMIYISGGSFSMGDNRGIGLPYERPAHLVSLSPFYIGKYQVTQAEYEAIMGYNPATAWGGVGDNLPVYHVNWYDAIKFCNLLSIQAGLEPVYSIRGSTDPDDWGEVPDNEHAEDSVWAAAICNWNAKGYRLPTEAEWEYAARGATGYPDYLYSGSDNIDEVAWYTENADQSTHPVGEKAPNELGIYDMTGNVDEWCWDQSDWYSDEPANNPTGSESTYYRISRGGYWWCPAYHCRVTSRSQSPPGRGSNYNGFRVCRNIY